jgi:hypothetical protein
MTLAEIKKTIEDGKCVYWKDINYKVVLDSKGEYLIKCQSNNHCIGLTWADDVTLNGKEEDFYIGFSKDDIITFKGTYVNCDDYYKVRHSEDVMYINNTDRNTDDAIELEIVFKDKTTVNIWI